jgi:hypothetical protein
MSNHMLRTFASLALLASAFLPVDSAAKATESSPAFSFYLTFLDRTAKTGSMADVAAFMPAWWNERQQSASAEDQAAAVERIRNSSQALKEVALEREEPVDSGVRLHMTARSADLPMQGTVLLIEEAGTFKVEESSWRSVEPIVN